MNHKFAVPGLLLVSLLFVSESVLGAIDTRDIELVRSKSVLESSDFKVIDDFVNTAVRSLVKTEDFSSVAQVRKTLVSRAASATDSAKAQYSHQFLDSSLKYIGAAMATLDNVKDERRRFLLTVNLLILTDELVDRLKDITLADLATPKVEDENMVVRYWAVRCLANSQVINLGRNPDIAQRIFRQLARIVDTSNSEIIKLIAEFAASVKDPQGEPLLLQIADMRLKAYADWKTGNSYLDGVVLKSLWGRMGAVGANTKTLGQRFGQLYSYVMQQYIKDLDGGNFLSKKARAETASVLIEIEQMCISKTLGRTQAIKKAIDRRDVGKLRQEHDRLLGSSTARGTLAVKLGYNDYVNAAGGISSAPILLGERPKAKIVGQ